jgi:hypothetical protein
MEAAVSHCPKASLSSFFSSLLTTIGTPPDWSATSFAAATIRVGYVHEDRLLNKSVIIA